MNLRIRLLQFTDGVSAMGGAMSVSNGAMEGGPRAADSIQRLAGGYLIGWKGRLYFIPDTRIESALVEYADGADDAPERPAPRQPPPAPTVPAAQAREAPTPVGEGIVQLPNGQFMRAAAKPAEPDPAEAKEGVPYQPKKRRPGPKAKAEVET